MEYTYPCSMDHTLGGTSSTRGEHDEEWMIEWELLKLELNMIM